MIHFILSNHRTPRIFLLMQSTLLVLSRTCVPLFYYIKTNWFCFCSFIIILNMSSNNERVFVVGASGGIGTDVVRGLINKKITTTAYVRDEEKAKNLFKDELLTGYLTLAVGTYTTIDVFTKVIQGHTRLFMVVVGDRNKPVSMWQIKGTLGKIAFEQGVRQIVDLSSFGVRIRGKQGIIGYMHTSAEEKLWALAEEDPEQRSLVVLRPAAFMSNHLMIDARNIKRSNKIVSCAPPSSTMPWIDTKGT